MRFTFETCHDNEETGGIKEDKTECSDKITPWLEDKFIMVTYVERILVPNDIDNPIKLSQVRKYFKIAEFGHY